MNNKRFEFTEKELFHLRAVHATGGTIAEAAKEMGVGQDTFAKAARRSDYLREVSNMYPRMAYQRQGSLHRRSEMEVVPMDQVSLQVDTGLLHVRAAIMRWAA